MISPPLLDKLRDYSFIGRQRALPRTCTWSESRRDSRRERLATSLSPRISADYATVIAYRYRIGIKFSARARARNRLEVIPECVRETDLHPDPRHGRSSHA